MKITSDVSAIIALSNLCSMSEDILRLNLLLLDTKTMDDAIKSRKLGDSLNGMVGTAIRNEIKRIEEVKNNKEKEILEAIVTGIEAANLKKEDNNG